MSGPFPVQSLLARYQDFLLKSVPSSLPVEMKELVRRAFRAGCYEVWVNLERYFRRKEIHQEPPQVVLRRIERDLLDLLEDEMQ